MTPLADSIATVGSLMSGLVAHLYWLPLAVVVLLCLIRARGIRKEYAAMERKEHTYVERGKDRRVNPERRMR